MMAWRFPLYMLREFVPLFFIFVAVLLVMVTIDYVAVVAGYVITYKAPFTLFIQSWLERFPYLLSYITPPSLAITILIGLGRLAKDSELKAAYSAGVQPLRLVWPIMGFSLLVAFGVFYNTNYVQPVTDGRFLETYYKILGRPGAPKTQSIKSFNSPDGKTLFHAGSLTPRDNDPFVADLVGAMIVTPDGTWTSTQGVWDARLKTWTLTNTVFSKAPLQFDDNFESSLGDVQSGAPVRPQVRRVFPFEFSLAPDAKPPEQLALPELMARAKLETLSVQERYLANFNLQGRFANPFSCLVFALVAASVGLTITSRGWAFASVIMIIAGYWAFWVLGKNLAGSQATPEWVAAWLPAMVFGAGSVLSLRRLV
jgi:lipopolysaccharide export system permease protein